MKDHIVGHRGAGYLAPENTEQSFRLAAELGLRYVEYDVRLTADDIVVVSHDDSLLRCAGIDLNISESRYDDIRDVDVSRMHTARTEAAALLTFTESLELMKELNLIPQIELKVAEGKETELAGAVHDILDDFYEDESDEDLRPLITSFNPAVLQILMTTQYETGLLVSPHLTPTWAEHAKRAGCDFVHINSLCLTSEIAAQIAAQGYKLNGYHVNHPHIVQLCMSRNMQRFTCDLPDMMLEVLS